MNTSFASSLDPRITTIPPESLTLTATPENNHYAYKYQEETYNNRVIIQNCLFLICVIYYLLYIISLFVGNKRVIAEGIMVAQAAYAGLVACPLLSPLQSAITTLFFANNPYNIYYSDSYIPFDDDLLPQRLRGVEMYSQYIYNINNVLVFIFLPLILGLIVLLIGCFKCLG